MVWFRRSKAKSNEVRSLENPDTPISSDNILKFFGLDNVSASGVNVTLESAMTVPAVLAAVEFLSSTIASLPLNVFKKTDKGREKQTGLLQSIVHDAANDDTTSFDWRKYSMARTLTNGRSLTYIERDGSGRIANLFPLDPSLVKIVKSGMKKRYIYNYGKPDEIVYESKEIIDIPFSIMADGLSALSPIIAGADAIGLAIASTNYGSKFFNNGGVPPFVIQGNFETGKGLKRASAELEAAIKTASKENKMALALPLNHELKPIGADPDKAQLVEVKRFQIEEIARLFSLPPVFLQDLTHGTFSNTEQQDLHLVKHTLRRWVTQHEQEMNLKLFGRGNTEMYVEFNLDGLLRGDFTTRMSGYATGIQNAILTPNEARAQENREDHDNANDLLIQGATVPLGKQPMQEPVTEPAAEPEGDTDE